MFHVTFPGIGLELDINRVAFTIGNMPIYWYGICIASGLLLALLFAFWKARDFGIDSDRMIDVVFLTTVIAVVCARAFYVAFAPFEYESLWDMINLRDGGIAIYGAVIGAFVSGWALCKWRKIPVLPMFDLAAMGFLIGQALGRWGNFFNKEAFGGFTDNLFAMRYQLSQVRASDVTPDILQNLVTVNGVDYIQVHPTFLYESMWSLCVFIILLILQRKKKFDGQVCATYFFGYALGRVWIEGLRTDQLCIGNVPVSQALSAVLIIASVVLYVYCKKKAAVVPVTEGANAETEQKEE